MNEKYENHFIPPPNERGWNGMDHFIPLSNPCPHTVFHVNKTVWFQASDEMRNEIIKYAENLYCYCDKCRQSRKEFIREFREERRKLCNNKEGQQ